jgi:signal transduction histidine kinase
MSELLAAFSEPGFMPHGHCYLWTPDVLWVHVGSDALIAAAYFSIPVALVMLVRRREDLVFNWMFLLFGAFIFFCGLTHVFNIWTTWYPVYRLEGFVKLVTGVVSAATALLVWPLLPRVLRIPSAGQLHEANERYRQLNAELEQRVRERTEELEQRNTDLQSFSQFLSHELRQPLHTLALGIPVLEGATQRSDAERQTIERMHRAVFAMADQIEAQLSLAQASARELASERVDLGALARELVEEMESELRRSDARVEIAMAMPPVTGDSRALRQLLRNLLENALKYRRADAAPRVRIEGESHPARPGFVRVRIQDNGRGFDSSDSERIFERFERAHAEVRGSGIGLTLCRRIAERHGGSIAASGRAGEGAIFELTLPAGS